MPHKYIINIMNLEVYAKIKDYPNYAISNHGVVINIKSGKKLKQCKGNHGYYVVSLFLNGKGKSFCVHRLVACAFLDKIEGKDLVDHIDNCKSNNYLSNLRFGNNIENARNAKLSSKNTSGIKGVSFSKKYNKWEAYIMNNSKKEYLGYFDNLEDAKIARQNKSIELFQEFQNECEK